MKKYKQNCKTCAKYYEGYGKYYCSSACQPRKYANGSDKIKGEKHYNWKGDNAGYTAHHIWIRNQFGRASICENPKCLGLSKRFEWALLKGKVHAHKRENYWQLCKPCHTRYDEINKGDKSHFWKGGRPECKNCSKKLTNYKNKTSLCGACNRKINPPWKGKARDVTFLNKARLAKMAINKK